MFRHASILLLCAFVGLSHGMDCNFGQSKNILDEYINSCPGVLQDSSKSYCCYDISKERVYCCDAQEFAIKTGLGIIIPAVIAVVVVVMFIIFCISCLCCSCCPWYRRRHRGTVYGIQGPNVIQVIQPPANAGMPPQAIHNAYAYPANQMAMPNHGQAPPQYTSEAYVKQAPYNPSYGQ
ncbi:protein shisa-4-like isoform X2 [Venturia canescens]|uniref:protein shisa-4-like isoform X2 n=1 Tax=Venturia canescens TaxID=32260 RepID=UPI001C9D4A1C|nr:protein shisa-4-like isoform X2 [Venturia canescens]